MRHFVTDSWKINTYIKHYIMHNVAADGKMAVLFNRHNFLITFALATFKSFSHLNIKLLFFYSQESKMHKLNTMK